MPVATTYKHTHTTHTQSFFTSSMLPYNVKHILKKSPPNTGTRFALPLPAAQHLLLLYSEVSFRSQSHRTQTPDRGPSLIWMLCNNCSATALRAMHAACKTHTHTPRADTLLPVMTVVPAPECFSDCQHEHARPFDCSISFSSKVNMSKCEIMVVHASLHPHTLW